MIPVKEIKTLFFDYDGTLHDSIRLYAPAFRKAYEFLVEKDLAKAKEWTEEEISYWLGYNSKDMWKSFRPDLSTEIQKQCSEIIGREMERYIKEGKPKLYEGSLDTLAALKEKGYHLIFISNCKVAYMENHKKMFHLDNYFEEFLCSEAFDFKPKYDILALYSDNYPQKKVIIGDRKQDMEAGIKNNIYTIGCTYGYGSEDELKESDMLIQNICELKKLFLL
jgi:phosphoglycolate phosphatase